MEQGSAVFIIFKEEFMMMLCDVWMSTQAVLQLPCLFYILFCLLIFVKFVLVFEWLGLAPEVCIGGSGGGDIYKSFCGCCWEWKVN